MLRVQEFLPTATVTVCGMTSTLPSSVEAEVESLWLAEQQRRGKFLFNGQILSAVSISSERIIGRVVEYRHLIAQRARPDLFDHLMVRPVAVSGLFKCADGIVFGRRSGTMTQDAGLWELVPSGGIDTSKGIKEGGEIDYRAQIIAELQEEIGIDPSSVSLVRPFCLVEDPVSHVLDIGIALVSPLSYDSVRRVHHETAKKEYDELCVIPSTELDSFVKDKKSELVCVSRMLIEHFHGHVLAEALAAASA